MAARAVTLKVIHRLQAFSTAIRRTFVQHFTRFQLTMCSHGSSALAELLVQKVVSTCLCHCSVRAINFENIYLKLRLLYAL